MLLAIRGLFERKIFSISRNLPVISGWSSLNFLFTEETIFSGTQLDRSMKNSYWGISVGVVWQSY